MQHALVARRWALATLCAVLFLTFLDNTIVSVVLGAIEITLHSGVVALQWVVDGYALVFAALMLFGGSVGDLLGRKKVMLVGVAIFCVGSVISAVAVNTNMVIAGRVVMGLGAAASEPGTLSMLRQVYPEGRARARALGAWSAISGLALALGPVIGGALVGLSGWRDVFWFNVIFGGIAFFVAWLMLPESSDPEGRKLDIPGLVFGAVALGALTFAIIEGEMIGYTTWWIILLFVVGAAAIYGFYRAEARSPDPVIDLSFFRNRAFVGPNIVVCIAYFGIFALFFTVALYLQFVVSLGGYQVALIFVPMMATLILGSAVAGFWVSESGPRTPMVVGCVIAAAGILLTDALITSHATFATISWPMAIAGAGFGLVLVPVTSTVLGVVPAERSGMAASATNTARQLGAVFGVAILGSLIYGQLAHTVSHRMSVLGIPQRYFPEILGHLTHAAGIAPPPGVHVPVGKFVATLTHGAYAGFGTGLDVALILSGALLAISAVISAFSAPRLLGVAGEPRSGGVHAAGAVGPSKSAH
jgi:EmrB/QacA subfamily drug resistance transporter